MILPLFAFLLLDVPDMSPTEGPSAMFRLVDPSPDLISTRLELCFDNIERVSIEFDDTTGQMALQVRLTEAAGRQLSLLTAAHVGKRADFAIGDKVFVSPLIAEPIRSGSLQITGIDTIAELEQMRQAARAPCTLPKAITE